MPLQSLRYLERVAYDLRRVMYERAGDNVSAEQRQKKFVKYIEKHQHLKEDVLWEWSTGKGIGLLHLAAARASLPTVQALIDAGADIHCVDRDGNGLIHYAFNIIGALEANELNDIEVRDNPCDFAVVDWALQQGFDINSLNHLGQTPIFVLASHLKNFHIDAEDREIIHQFINAFIARGGNICHRDHYGRTFVDVDVDHDEWYEVADCFDVWRAKIQQQDLLQEVGDIAHRQVTHKKM